VLTPGETPSHGFIVVEQCYNTFCDHLKEQTMRAVGSSYPRIDARDKVAGVARYAGDIDLPGQAWAKILFAGFPHGRITAIDCRDAIAAPGVIAVLTAEDVPVNEYGLIMPDQPVLCGPGSTKQAEVVRWEADHVAIVVAETARGGRGGGRPHPHRI
jgi:CO/xanthine dehydrogenase Mo-binding subunit